jgi:tRNA threonylcarbamoyladenosine biosynthesis protein TsaB
MLLLAVDTSGRAGSLALARGNDSGLELIEQAPLSSRSYSAEIVPVLSGLLARHGYTKFDLEAFAVVSGPGSFTGLRVGLAAVKGLAEILGRPIAAVSMLEAIAAQAGADGGVIAAMDAGRRELYVGEYEIRSACPHCQRERLLNEAEFKVLVEQKPSSELITTDLRVIEIVPQHLAAKQVEWPGADVIARLGWAKLQAGQQVSAELLEANYIRRSDAEIHFHPPA